MKRPWIIRVLVTIPMLAAAAVEVICCAVTGNWEPW